MSIEMDRKQGQIQSEYRSTLQQGLKKHIDAIGSAVKTMDRMIRTVHEIESVTPEVGRWILKWFYLVLDSYGSQAPSYPSVIFIGPPGVGKSTIVRETAGELAGETGRILVNLSDEAELYRMYSEIEGCGNDQDCLSNLEQRYFAFLDLRLTEIEPQDLLGIPRMDGGVMRYAPPLWAVVLRHIPGILFLDELSNVDRPDVLAASYKILLDRSAGFVKFHPKVMVVAAGNLQSHAPGLARPLPMPLINRSSVFYVDAPDVDSWYEWTYRKLTDMLSNHDASILNDHLKTLSIVKAYLSTKPSSMIRVGAEARNVELNENTPTPRAWSHFVFTTPASLMDRLREVDVRLLTSYIASFVGNAVASDFVTAAVVGLFIDYDEIFSNPEKIKEVIDRVEQKPEAAAVTAFLIGNEFVKRTMDTKSKVELAKRIAKVLREVGDGMQMDVAGEAYRELAQQNVVELTAGLGKAVVQIFLKAVYDSYNSMIKRAEGRDVKRLMEEKMAVGAAINEVLRL